MATLYRDPYERLAQLAEGVDPANLPVDQAPQAPVPIVTDQAALRRAELEMTNAGRSESARAINQGVQNLGSSARSIRGLARIGLGDEEGGLEDLRYAENQQRVAQEMGPRVQNFDQIESAGDAAEWLRNNTLTQLPNIAASVASGGTGGALRVAAGGLARRQAARLAATEAAELGGEAAARAGAAAAARTGAQQFAQGSALGGAVSGVAQQASIAPGIVLDQDPNNTASVRERAGAAAVGAVATGALEALPVMRLFNRYGLGGAAEAISGSMLQRIGRNAVKQGVDEATTEVLQTAGEKAAHKWVNENVQVMGPDAYGDYLNAAAGGFFGGAVFGAPAGLRGAGNNTQARERMGERVRSIYQRIGQTGERQGPENGPAPTDGGDSGAPGATFGDAVASRARQATEQVAAVTQGLRQAAGRVANAPEVQRATQATQQAATQATNRVTELYNRIMQGRTEQSAVDAALDPLFDQSASAREAIMSADPLDYRNETSGEASFNRPFNNFIDTARARRLVGQGVAVDRAAVLSSLPEERAVELNRSGAVNEAMKVLRGDNINTVDGAKLGQYMDALTPEARNMFVRTGATMQELAAADYIQRDASGRAENAQIATPPAQVDVDAARESTSDFDVAENTTNETPMRTSTAALLRGAVVRGEVPAGAITTTDARGRVRRATPAQLGKALTEVKADQDFQDSTRTVNATQRNVMALAQVLGDLQQAGTPLNIDTLKPGMELAPGWKLTAQTIQQVRNGMQPARQRAAVPQGPITRDTARARSAGAEQRQRDLVNDPGAVSPADIEQVATGEDATPDAAGRVLGPRNGRPAELSVSREGRVSEAQTQDSGDIDPQARRDENATQWGPPERRARLDEAIRTVTGTAPTDARSRGEGINAARARLTGANLNAFNERVYDVMRDRRIRADAQLAQAQTAWQALRSQYANEQRKANPNQSRLTDLASKGREARQALDIARNRAAQAKTTEDQARRQIKGRPAQVRREARLQDQDAPDGAIPDRLPNTNAGEFTDAIGKTRSRAAIFDAINRVANARGMSENRKIELLLRLREREQALKVEVHRAAKGQIERAGPGNASTEHHDAVRAILSDGKKRNLEQALASVRTLATPAQQRYIDTLTQMGSLRGLPFEVAVNENYRDGTVGGVHAYMGQRNDPLDSMVRLNFSARATAGNTNTDPIYVLLHEATHAATTVAENRNPTVRRDVEAMLEHARTEAAKMGIDPNQWYGLAETQEFLAEAFSNPQMQAMLEQMPAANTSSFRNLWEQFKGFVRELLGIKGNRQINLLDEVFAVGLEMGRQTAEARFESTMNALALTEGLQAQDSALSSVQGNLATNPTAGSQLTDYSALLAPEMRLKLLAAFSRGDIRHQIEQRFPNLAQQMRAADTGPELTINAGLALAINNQLNLDGAVKPAVQALSNAVRDVLQIPSANSYARQIVADLRAGKVNRSYDARQQKLNPTVLSITRWMERNVTPKIDALTTDIDQRMRASGVPALTQLATLMSQRTGEFRSDSSESFQGRVARERNKRMNDFFAIIGDWSDAKKEAVTRALQAQQRNAFLQEGDVYENVDADARKVLDFFKKQFDYIQGAGLRLGKTKDYFPVTIDGEAIAARKDEFIALLEEPNLARYVKRMGGAEKLYRQAVASTGRGEQTVAGVTFADGAHDPSFKPLNERLSAFIYKHGTAEQKAKFAEFQDAKLERIGVNYINRSVRRAEWNRLGLGENIKTLLGKAQSQGASDKQMNMARDYVDQIMGTYGQDWHPAIKRVFEGMDQVFGSSLATMDFNKFRGYQQALMTYQNVRLLPLALMSSLIDPLGSSVRSGGDFGQQFRSMREAVRALRNEGGNDALRAAAEDMGIIERHAANEALIYLYGGQVDPSGRLAKINNALFKYNGLELTTKFSRLTALSMGHRFLAKHAARDDATSNRYLEELGLQRSDIALDDNGFVRRTEKVDAALARFVDESVLRPTAAQRPVWHNDPHFALAAQYKGYLYAFYNTVVRRAGVELDNGNFRVLAPIMMYLPVTAAGEMLRDAFQGDDDDRDAWDYAKLSVERSGLLGPKINLLTSAQQDVSFGQSALNSLTGPTGQQLGQLYDAFNGQRDLGRTAVQALPGSTLYDDWGDGYGTSAGGRREGNDAAGGA